MVLKIKQKPIKIFRSWINSPLLELYYSGWNWKKAYSPSVSYIEKEAFLKLNGFSMWYHPLERHPKLDFSRINRVHKNKSWLKIERNTMLMACTGNEFIFHVNSNSVLIELEKKWCQLLIMMSPDSNVISQFDFAIWDSKFEHNLMHTIKRGWNLRKTLVN